MSEHPLIESLSQLQYDLSVMKTRVAEIQRQIATLSFVAPKRYPCPKCQIPFPSVLKRDEHIYRLHDGPTPPHWLEDEEATPDMREADTVVPAPRAPTAKEGVPRG